MKGTTHQRESQGETKGETKGTTYWTHAVGAGHFEPNHPEQPNRVRAIVSRLEQRKLTSSYCQEVPARPVTTQELLRFHTHRHLQDIQALQPSEIRQYVHRRSPSQSPSRSRSRSPSRSRSRSPLRSPLRSPSRSRSRSPSSSSGFWSSSPSPPPPRAVLTVPSSVQPSSVQPCESQWNSVYVTTESMKEAKMAAGAVLDVATVVAQDPHPRSNGFAVVRPPGHHSSADTTAGFCVFHNVACAAANILANEKNTVKKICILDMDIHSGSDGTNHNAFYDRDDVLTIDLHRYDNGSFYPGGITGHPSQTGSGSGDGHNVNIAWNHENVGDADYALAFDHVVVPIMKKFQPDLVLVSAGCDCICGDPLGDANVTPAAYGDLLEKVRQQVQAKMVVCLEGGYDLNAISTTFEAVVERLVGAERRVTQTNFGGLAHPQAFRSLARTARYVMPYWDSSQ